MPVKFDGYKPPQGSRSQQPLLPTPQTTQRPNTTISTRPLPFLLPESCTICFRALDRPGKPTCKACKSRKESTNTVRDHPRVSVIVPPQLWKAEESLDHPRYRINVVPGTERTGWMK
ncbi:hypothetical protein ABVK25_001313 [Lepraria finkii]|uniref:Uncharacterized protein n=1 Tax=Lepraria finkii TaxID=1340010 RepID=A0ABR4BLG4_9LECA